MKELLTEWRKFVNEGRRIRITSADEYAVEDIPPTWDGFARVARYLEHKDRGFKRKLEQRIYDHFLKGKKFNGKSIVGLELAMQWLGHNHEPDDKTPQYMRGYDISIWVRDVNGNSYVFKDSSDSSYSNQYGKKEFEELLSQ